ncbi:hypothetical protein QLQ12_46540, partial [Actinoplanes sp. NEAU-A12]
MSEYSGFVLRQDPAADHASESCSGAFDMFRGGVDADGKADVFSPHSGRLRGENGEDLLVGGA